MTETEIPKITKLEDGMGNAVFQAFINGDLLSLGRIVGGVAWPEVGRPGFLVVLGEDNFDDVEAGGRHVHLLLERGEFGGESFMSLEAMLHAIQHLRGKMRCLDWYGMEPPRPTVLTDYNRAESKLKRPPLRIKEIDDPSFDWMLDLVFQRTVTRKLLHFYESSLPGMLSSLPADIGRTGKFQDSPPVTALVFALAGLEGRRPASTTPHKKFIADRVAGY
jgi:hypothetical protein